MLPKITEEEFDNDLVKYSFLLINFSDNEFEGYSKIDLSKAKEVVTDFYFKRKKFKVFGWLKKSLKKFDSGEYIKSNDANILFDVWGVAYCTLDICLSFNHTKEILINILNMNYDNLIINDDLVCTFKEYQAKYKHQEKKKDPMYIMTQRLRARVRGRMNRVAKDENYTDNAGSAISDLGCTMKELKKYIEDQFTDGMTWENIGEWHIDHIHPISEFDLTNKKDFLEACHFKNLQPLWAKDNLSKGSKTNWKKSG